MSTRVSYWLLPAEPEKARLAGIIADFSRRFRAPRFEPHVTIYSGPLGPDENVEKVIAHASAGASGIVLHSTGIAHSEQYTKTLFVKFADNEHLATLCANLMRHSARPMDYDLQPHLSFMYALLSPEVKAQLAGEIRMPPNIRFDSVAAMISNGATKTHEDVETWQIVATRPF